MQLGMIGLGRMGANMARRLLARGHECVVYDTSAEAVHTLVEERAVGTASLEELARSLTKPRAIRMMVPAGSVDRTVSALLPHLEQGDVLIDGGNSYYIDDIRRSKELASKGIHYIDAGTSGGVWGLERGYCLMIGAEGNVAKHLDPIFASLAPGRGDIPRTPSHFVNMVHNGIEYGILAAYVEGLAILKAADIGKATDVIDAETTPLRDPELYKYELNLPDIAEFWRRGSVISSWLLDLSATALLKKPTMSGFAGRVSDSGEGRWTIRAAIDEGVPAHVLSSALYERFSSRGNADFADKLLSAMRDEFGTHLEKPVKS
jgi:6-phosphogluconate dehydrogenase